MGGGTGGAEADVSLNVYSRRDLNTEKSLSKKGEQLKRSEGKYFLEDGGR